MMNRYITVIFLIAVLMTGMSAQVYKPYTLAATSDNSLEIVKKQVVE